MLESVVEDQDIGAAGLRLDPTPDPVGVHHHRHTGQAAGELQRFVPEPLSTDTSGSGPTSTRVSAAVRP